MIDDVEYRIIYIGEIYTIARDSDDHECYFIDKNLEVKKAPYVHSEREWFPGQCFIQVEKKI